MTIAFFDCFAGISGDMTLGALIDSGADKALVEAAVEAMRLGDEVKIEIRREARGHIEGTRVLVGVNDRTERTVPALRATVEDAGVPDAVKRQYVLDQMAKDPTGIQGPRTIKEGIAHDTGENITRYMMLLYHPFVKCIDPLR